MEDRIPLSAYPKIENRSLPPFPEIVSLTPFPSAWLALLPLASRRCREEQRRLAGSTSQPLESTGTLREGLQ